MTNADPLGVCCRFWGYVSRSDGRAGFTAAERSSKDPATARKAEKKKRSEGARIVTQGNTPTYNLLGNLCASRLHDRAYNRAAKRKQPPAYLFNTCTKCESAIINKPAIRPQKAPEIPAKETPDAVTRKVTAAASRDSTL